MSRNTAGPDAPTNAAALAHEVAIAIARVREILAPIDEAVAGYRTQLEKDGWSPTAAETMALTMHTALMTSFVSGSQ